MHMSQKSGPQMNRDWEPVLEVYDDHQNIGSPADNEGYENHKYWPGGPQGLHPFLHNTPGCYVMLCDVMVRQG